MVRITLPSYRIEELESLETGECIDVWTDDGIFGYIEKIPQDFNQIHNLTIRGKKYSFNYYYPDKVKVESYLCKKGDTL